MLRIHHFPRALRHSCNVICPRRAVAYARAESAKDLSKELQPFYELKPSWWMSSGMTYFLLATDLLVTGAASVLTWKYWTRWEPLPGEQDGQQRVASGQQVQGPSQASEDEGEPKGRWALRPWSQRVPWTVGQLFIGTLFASVLWGARRRHVRRMYLVPGSPSPTPGTPRTIISIPRDASQPGPSPPTPPISEGKDERQVILQCFVNFPGRAMLAPISECYLVRGKSQSAVGIYVQDAAGPFWIHLDDGEIRGKKLPVSNARDEIFSWWYGPKMGMKLRSEERWKNGR